MKKILLFFLFVGNYCNSQIQKPVTWETSVQKNSSKDYNLIFTATIKSGWRLYALKTSKTGPLATTFHFDENHKYTILSEKIFQEKGVTIYNEKTNITFFNDSATFIKPIEKESQKPLKIYGNIDYISCNNDQCITSNYKFEINI